MVGIFRNTLRVVGATRPWSFSMTAISVALGALAAGTLGRIDWWLVVLTLSGTLCLHAATNLANDYYDYRTGIDTPDSPGVLARHHPLVERTLLPRQVLAGAIGFWIAAVLIAAVLSLTRGWPIAVLTGVAVLAGFFYSATPLRLKAWALGEVTAFIMWGPLMVMGAFFVQRKTFTGSRQALVVAVIQGLWVALVLLSNNLRDKETDAALRIHTPATLLGSGAARALTITLSSAVYLIAILAVLAGVLGPWALLVILSVPLTAKLLVSFYGPQGVPGNAPTQTAQTAMIFGLLLVLSEVLSLILPF